VLSLLKPSYHSLACSATPTTSALWARAVQPQQWNLRSTKKYHQTLRRKSSRSALAS